MPGPILVTGATGQQGGATARELLRKGFDVVALTRRPDDPPARALAELGAQVVFGDFDDPESLKTVLSGKWGVFAMQNTWEAGVEQEEVQGKRMAGLAREAGVEHFVYTSVASAWAETGIPHFDNKWRIEGRVRELGFPSFVIIRPVFFMDNFLSPWFKPALEQGTLAMSLPSDRPFQSIAVTDIGKYGSLAFERAADWNGLEIDIAGDELSPNDIAAMLGEISGRDIQHFAPPIEEVRAFSPDFATMLEWFDAVGYSADIAATSEQSGVRPTRFREWASAQDW